MHLQSFSYQGFRNLSSGQIELSPQLSIFIGDNGAGKSSILEAISLITSGRSFRTNKLNLLTNNEQNEFTLFGVSSEGTRLGLNHQNREKRNRIKIDGQNIKSLSSLAKIYPTQVLCPESYHLVDSGPSERRKYLDWCLFHVEHSYFLVWKKFNDVLKQRNALLKTRNAAAIKNQIGVWDSQVVDLAEQLNGFRQSILEKLLSVFNQLLAQLGVEFCNDLSIKYYKGYTEDLKDKLRASITQDIERGYTQYGPHKADLRIKVQGVLAKDSLSRGQKKVLINSLFLAQTILLKQLTKKDSLFIIDDFTSELDTANQKALLETLLKQNNVQIILSCLQQEALKWLEKGYNRTHMFHVEHGTISAIKDSNIAHNSD